MRSLLITLAILAAAGCSSDTYPVKGKVAFTDGSPVGQARVIFRSKFDGEHISAFATTDENGEYSLTTWQTDDGAVLGEHVVIVTKPRQVGTDQDGQKVLLPPEIHEKYASFETSPLRFTVDNKDNEFDITIEHAE